MRIDGYDFIRLFPVLHQLEVFIVYLFHSHVGLVSFGYRLNSSAVAEKLRTDRPIFWLLQLEVYSVHPAIANQFETLVIYFDSKATTFLLMP